MNKDELAEFYAEQDKWKRDHLNLITAVDDQALMAVDGDDMVWVQVPCAVDSGACANVSPAGIFSLEKSLLDLEPSSLVQMAHQSRISVHL